MGNIQLKASSGCVSAVLKLITSCLFNSGMLPYLNELGPYVLLALYVSKPDILCILYYYVDKH